MTRALFDDEHEAFRDTVGTFLDKEIVPHHAQWEAEGIVAREAWSRAGALGLLGLQLDEELGGGGTTDFRYNVVLNEEMTRRGVYGPAYPLFNDMIVPYLLASADDEQKRRWFPGLCSGELIAAIAMTEPGAGSDLQGIRTTARWDEQTGCYVLNGQKTFISNGILADLVIVVCRTNPDAGHQGISLLVVERGMEGFERGRNLDKIGQHAQDTAELFFDDVRVPRENLLGEEGAGFGYLMTNLSQERLSIAVAAVSACEMILEDTLSYAKERTAFGKPIGSFQHSRFVLAEMETEVCIAEQYLDRAVAEHNAGRFDVKDAAMAKWWTTELQKRVVDQCVQLHGGYGYMLEYPVAKAFIDSRVQTIYGGTTEVMKEIIGRTLGV